MRTCQLVRVALAGGGADGARHAREGVHDGRRVAAGTAVAPGRASLRACVVAGNRCRKARLLRVRTEGHGTSALTRPAATRRRTFCTDACMKRRNSPPKPGLLPAEAGAASRPGLLPLPPPPLPLPSAPAPLPLPPRRLSPPTATLAAASADPCAEERLLRCPKSCSTSLQPSTTTAWCCGCAGPSTHTRSWRSSVPTREAGSSRTSSTPPPCAAKRAEYRAPRGLSGAASTHTPTRAACVASTGYSCLRVIALVQVCGGWVCVLGGGGDAVVVAVAAALRTGSSAQ
jgi:hypothetical protein